MAAICTNIAKTRLDDVLWGAVAATLHAVRLKGEQPPTKQEVAAQAEGAVLQAFTGLPVVNNAGLFCITLANGQLCGKGLRWQTENDQLNGMREMLRGFLQQAMNENTTPRDVHAAFEFAMRDIGASLLQPRTGDSNVVEWELTEGGEQVIISGYGTDWQFGPKYLHGLVEPILVVQVRAD